MSKYTDMSNELLKLIGGKDNVASVTHCATRLRIRLHDEDNVPVEEIKKLPGVLGLQKNVGEIQVIIGPAVDDAYQELMKLGGFETKTPKKTAPAQKREKGFKAVLNTLFSAMTGSGRTQLTPAVYKPSLVLRSKEIEQNHLCLSFPGVSALSEDRFTMNLLCNILGGGMSSRLFQSIREQSGLCYSIYTFTTPHQDTGLMSIYTGLGEETERRALERILQELHQFCEDGPAQDEISRTREQAKTTLLMGLESTGTRMMTIGRSELIRGEVSKIEDVLAGYDSVTRDDILELARRIFDPAQASLAVVGNPGAEDEYRELLSKHL